MAVVSVIAVISGVLGLVAIPLLIRDKTLTVLEAAVVLCSIVGAVVIDVFFAKASSLLELMSFCVVVIWILFARGVKRRLDRQERKEPK